MFEITKVSNIIVEKGVDFYLNYNIKSENIINTSGIIHEFSDSYGINYNVINPQVEAIENKNIKEYNFKIKLNYKTLMNRNCKIKLTYGDKCIESNDFYIKTTRTYKIFTKNNGEVLPLKDCLTCFVTEELNSIFELELEYPADEFALANINKESIIIANANDNLKNQEFYIYDIKKSINGVITVYARHISYILFNDCINEEINIENQSCEYALNQIFSKSNFCKDFIGKSDIINAENVSIGLTNCMDAIFNEENGLLRTYGTNSDILRDNKSISILNKRGHDNEVFIEYKKNITGFECEEDISELVTRILPIAKIKDEDGKETIIKGDYVDSDNINKFMHPYIQIIDFSDKFKEENPANKNDLNNLARKYFTQTKCDMPKVNYKIEFVPLSKCVGYENIKDDMDLGDIVNVKNDMYDITTKARVIKTVYNCLTDRYESIELGEPRTNLNDIFGGSSTTPEQGPPGPPGPPGQDGSAEDFPDTLPPKSVLTGKSIGLASIELTWTFENKVYYSYELYASKTKDFTPNTFDLIYEGQASAFLFQAKPNETWYFRVCAINSHGNRNEFSEQVTVSTAKINGNDWIEEATIGNALIGELSADKITSGTISGHYIDARNLSVTDGNAKRTLDIDSFGNVNLDVTSLKIKSNNVAVNNDIKEAIESERNNINESIKNEITDIENSLGSVLDYIDNAFKDNIIDENEKSSINERIIQLQKEKADIDAQIWQLKNYQELISTNELSELISCENNFNTCFNSYIEYLRNIINAEVQEPVPPVINQEAKMHFIATDHEGACTLIQTSNGKNILIDANEKVTASQIINYLKSINVSKLDMIIVTHYHSDHIGAMPAIMDYATCNGINVYHRQPDWSKMGDKEINEWLTKWYYDEFISKCNAKGVNLITPTERQRLNLGEGEYIEFYNTNNQDYSNYNGLSFGLLYVLGDSRCFLAGDMTYNSENLVGKGTIGQVDLHKTGHHGWNYSTQEWFAKELNAKYNILEALRINDETRRNARSVLQKNNLPIYSLASNGTIVATIKPSGVSLNKNTTDVLRDIWWQHQETNNWYWWKNNGQLAKSETLNLGGKNYDFDSEGICLNPY